MAITASEVKKLREMTGAGMMDCKKALTESNGDFDGAVDILRKQGQKISAKRADRDTSEGAVFIEIFNNDSEGVIIGLGCETDFVALNEEFVKLGNEIAQLAASKKPSTTEELLKLEIGGQALEAKITDFVGKMGEKISIVGYNYLSADKLAAYIHSNGKVGVLVAMDNAANADYDAIGKDLGMQIAAMNPVALDENGVDSKITEREMAIGVERAREEGKPENLLDRIAQGYVKKYLQENTLMNQAFVKDPKVTIAQYVKNEGKGMEIKTFKRVSVGE
ncbi:translation elongation factor Ts (EF-Ts) [Bernardetia litoralis DSM 6794]|uniref:Elongation factor Ts n=1 Tax=Bernardetia litoralis (strain ATCC 23117 / DSM 6794 / NBRC 15988 / NCIMB 1366 / Fx l1 / Sio-4) TaxID=880071 RepID=I4AJE0_BERLS|nr:translation elongation factor Ts [Bernardetia litoralis]AFM04075.1 translation elongation factor Ts (EF-Ts) [Bernardetia litoralis DSM 6794]